ncbi:MAG: TIGR04282 family arsenosugar biosynthesis glycosyltransferase, partial [Candidatus Omnitrophota bacterium]|nr:TIGR04282 family arsenosugar biosynthesis glycosyltransferase [Candidatus Omnitrophota bacterium]
DPPDKKQDILDWIGGGIELCHQVKGDLGVRLSNAFQSIFKNGAKRVVVIGSDSPTIDVRVIKKAFIELKTKDCVIGPSKDGGYYLLGLSSYHKEIFQGISWSTDKVFKETLDRLNASGLSLSTLEEGFDIDTVEDLELIKDRFPI